LAKLNKETHRFMVDFEIFTRSLSLEDLSKKIKIDASEGSRTMGQKNLNKRNPIAKETWFKLSSVLPENVKLDRHLDSIIKSVEKSRAFKKGILPKDSRFRICIADACDFHKWAYFELDISEKYVVWCGKHNVSLQVVVYPWAEKSN
jgi:hypothetical protein